MNNDEIARETAIYVETSIRCGQPYAEIERLIKSALDKAGGGRYEAELERAAEILGRILPIGQVKAIGLLEVAAALEEIERWLWERGIICRKKANPC